MKRNVMRVLAALFAMVMLMSCISVSSFATSGEAVGSTTTTTSSGTAPNGHTYELYQIFTGDVAPGTEKLSNPKYGVNAKLPVGKSIGDDVDESVINAIVAVTPNSEANKKADGTTYSEAEAVDYIKTLVDYNVGTETTYTPFSRTTRMPGYQNDGKDVQPTTNSSVDASSNSLVYNNLPSGYYMIKDKYGDGNSQYTLYVFYVTGGTLSFSPKGSAPTITKGITSASGSIDVDHATTAEAFAMGDTVSYVLKGTLSSYTTSFGSYYYQFTDKLSKGLTLDQTSIHVYVNDVNHEVTSYFYQKITKDSDGNTTLTLTIDDLFKLQNLGGNMFTAGTKITITGSTAIYVCYDATVNTNATVSSNITLGTGECDEDTANINSATVSYYNDPNVTGTTVSTDTPSNYSSHNADPENENTITPPSGKNGVPIVESEEDDAYVYVAGLKIQKINSANEPLIGAKFTLTSDNKQQKITYTNGDAIFTEIIGDVPDDATVYYKLNLENGTSSYTTVAPSTVTENERSQYAVNSSSGAYAMYTKTDSTVGTIELNAENSYSYEATVDDSGYLTFTGLGPGTYTLKETNAPTGYSAMASVTFTISYSATGIEQTSTSNKVPLKVSGDNTGLISYSYSDGFFHWNITDTAASSLPHTGGIGTTIFYVVGSCLVVGAAILLITKKRMNNEAG